jgi:methylmalonyl-CoA mutase
MADMTDISDLFPPVDEAAWRALVAKGLKDAPFESLTQATLEGLPVEPLYPAVGATPSAFTPRPYDAERPWDLRVLVSQPDPARANADALRDLEGGAASLLVKIDPTGADGVAVGSTDGLAKALNDVVLELAPVALDAGFLGPQAAEWLHGVAKSSPGAKLQFHLDPLSAFAAAGSSPGQIDGHLAKAAATGARFAEVYPAAQIFLASGVVVHEAGGGEAAELAFAMASTVAYARALVEAGASMSEAFSRITLGLAADTDHFLTIAKFRAARVLWDRVTAACGAQGPARIEARSSHRMLAAQDVWTNMLRLTAAGFGAAIGGADVIALGTFTDPLGAPTAFARRQSRNTQLVLMAEAHLGRVADPAAGAGYVEALTDAFARAAWSRFQAIEAKGGAAAALQSGEVAAQVDAARKAREAAGEPRIVGVTAFPPTSSDKVEVEHPKATPAVAPSAAGPGDDSRCPALSPIRLSEAFEGRA